MILPTDDKERKEVQIYTGFIKYFPRAIVAVTRQSVEGMKHTKDGKLWWDRSKSPDEKDALCRHILDGDWAAVAWRAMANLEKELEKREELRNATMHIDEPEFDRVQDGISPAEMPSTTAGCSVCGMRLDHVMGYCCPRHDCPTGMGPIMCDATTNPIGGNV